MKRVAEKFAGYFPENKAIVAQDDQKIQEKNQELSDFQNS